METEWEVEYSIKNIEVQHYTDDITVTVTWNTSMTTGVSTAVVERREYTQAQYQNALDWIGTIMRGSYTPPVSKPSHRTTEELISDKLDDIATTLERLEQRGGNTVYWYPQETPQWWQQPLVT